MPVWNTKDGVTSPTPETSSQLRPDQGTDNFKVVPNFLFKENEKF